MEEALLEPLIEAIEATKSDKVTIHSCEIVGSARFSLVQKYEPNIKNLSTTLNGDECIAHVVVH